MKRYKKIEHAEIERRTHDGRQEVNIDCKFDTYWDKFIKMIKELESMWNGHLGRIGVEKHHIEITLDQTWPICWVPYRAGPRTRELEKMEGD